MSSSFKTFTISYKVLQVDKVNPVEGETNGSMQVSEALVFDEVLTSGDITSYMSYNNKGLNQAGLKSLNKTAKACLPADICK